MHTDNKTINESAKFDQKKMGQTNAQFATNIDETVLREIKGI